MHSNPFSHDEQSTAWSEQSGMAEYLFTRAHIRIRTHLEEVELSLNPSPLRFFMKAHPDQVENLWRFVPPEAVTVNWKADTEEKSRSHSATSFVSAEQFLKFVNFDARLVLFWPTGPSGVAALFLPVKRMCFSSIAPPGSYDSTNVMKAFEARTANYQGWINSMRKRYAAVSNILTAVLNMDVADLATYMVSL